MSADKYSSIFSRQTEAIVYTNSKGNFGGSEIHERKPNRRVPPAYLCECSQLTVIFYDGITMNLAYLLIERFSFPARNCRIEPIGTLAESNGLK